MCDLIYDTIFFWLEVKIQWIPETISFLYAWLSSEEGKKAYGQKMRKHTLESAISQQSSWSAHSELGLVFNDPLSFHRYSLMAPSMSNLDRNDVNSRVLVRFDSRPVPVLRALPPSSYVFLIMTPWVRYATVILNMKKWRHKEMKQMFSSLIKHFWNV